MARLEKFTFKGKTYSMEPKQRLAAMYYVQNNFNGEKALIKAGYSKKSARTQAARLFAKENVKEYLDALREDLAACVGISAVDIARELIRIGFANVKNIVDGEGNIRPVIEMEDDDTRTIAAIEVFEEFQGQGTGKSKKYIGRTKKIKFHDKLGALNSLAKMIGVDGVAKTETTIKLGLDRAQDENYV